MKYIPLSITTVSKLLGPQVDILLFCHDSNREFLSSKVTISIQDLLKYKQLSIIGKCKSCHYA